MVSEQAGQPASTPFPHDLRDSEGRPKWYRRIGFWRAVAGMAFAAALAAVIVLAEFSRLLTHRTIHYSRRIAEMNETVRQLRRRVSSAERRNVAEVERASADDILKRVVSASDLHTIKLIDAGARRDKQPASGTLALSQSQHAAVLQVAGIEAALGGKVYRVWWQEKRGPETLAAQFIPDSDGKATVPLGMPPRTTASVVITCEVGPDGTQRSGAPILKGRITPEQLR